MSCSREKSELPVSTGAAHRCCIVPPYLLHCVAESDKWSDEIKAAAHNSLKFANPFHELRIQALSNIAGGETSGSGPTPLQAHGMVPDFLLKTFEETKNVDKETKKSLEQGSLLSKLLRESRRKAVEAAAQIPPMPRKVREIHDMNHKEDLTKLPGDLIYSEANIPPPEGGWSDATAQDCYQNLGHVFDYYHKVHSRNSINGNGLTLTASVHFGKSFPNALWQGSQMVFGDGNKVFKNFTKSLDIIGHELTHGVVQFTAGLLYDGQPGALNESLADVFGSLVKQWRAGQTTSEADWLIGEDCMLPDVKGVALRSLKAPGKAFDVSNVGKRDPQPRTMDDYVVTTDDYGGVHINSGIPNHAFYLVAKGATDAGLSDHAWEVAGAIWYLALHHGDMHPRCNFEQFAKLTYNIARTEYGDKAAKVVEDAWKSVKVPLRLELLLQTPKVMSRLKTLQDSRRTSIDVVIVCGLRERNYTPDSKHWPISFLAHDIPQARILGLEYPPWTADDHRQFTQERRYLPPGGPESLTVNDYAISPPQISTLVSKLQRLRKDSNTEHRKIVFIAYESGWLICGEIMRSGVFDDHTAGVIIVNPQLPSSASENFKFEWGLFLRYGQQHSPGNNTVKTLLVFPYNDIETPASTFQDALYETVLFLLGHPRMPVDLVSMNFNDARDPWYLRIVNFVQSCIMIDQKPLANQLGDILTQTWKFYTSCNISSGEFGDIAPQMAELHEAVLVNQNVVSRFVLMQDSMRSLANLYQKLSTLLHELQEQYSGGEVISSAKTPAGESRERAQSAGWRLRAIMRQFEEESLQVAKDKNHKPYEADYRKVFEKTSDNSTGLGGDGVNREDDVNTNLPLVSYPLDQQHPARGIWSDLEKGVRLYLERKNVQWTMFDLVNRRRPGVIYKKNSPDPVLLVMVSRDSSTDWRAIKQGLAALINDAFPPKLKTGGKIGVEIMDGKIEVQSWLGRGLLCNAVNKGGTLGGFIRLSKKESNAARGDWLPDTFILTNHHIINANEAPVTRAQADLTPITVRLLNPGECAEKISLNNRESTRLSDKHDNLLARNLSTTRINSVRARYRSPARQSSSVQIGQVWASSGIQVSRNGHRIDWAIIKVLEDGDEIFRGRNIIPRNFHSDYSMPLKIVPQDGQTGHEIRLSRASPIYRQQLVAKMGWRSMTYGVLETKSRAVSGPANSAWAVYGQELNSFPHKHPMSMDGDSGSWILNSEGDLIALLWGGDPSESTSYVTPIEDVIEDIEMKTGYIVSIPGGIDPYFYADNENQLPAAYRL